MMKVYLSICLKQHRLTIGGALMRFALASPIAIAIAFSHAPAKSQSLTANNSPVLIPQLAFDVKNDQQEAVQVIRDYYNEINRRDYQKAYSLWGSNGAASQQTFDQFKQGFADTASTSVTIGKPGEINAGAGSLYIEIPVTVNAVTKKGHRQKFRGSYVLRRVNDVPGSTPDQRRWHLSSANFTILN
jgi:hypothetical protein